MSFRVQRPMDGAEMFVCPVGNCRIKFWSLGFSGPRGEYIKVGVWPKPHFTVNVPIIGKAR